MKIEAKTSDVFAALAQLWDIVPVKLQQEAREKPALTFVKVKAGNGLVALTGSNGEQELEITIPGGGDGKPFLVPFHKLHQTLKGSSPGQPVKLEVIDGKLKGAAGSFLVKDWETMDVKLFPVLSAGKSPTAGFMCPVEKIGWAMQYPFHAIPEKPTANYVEGLLFSFDKFERKSPALATVATDGRQLVRCVIGEFAKKDGALKPNNFEGVVPRAAVKAMVNLLLSFEPDDNDQHQMAVRQYDGKNGRMTFQAHNWKMTTKTAQGEFPAYQRGIPRSDDATATMHMDVEVLDAALHAHRSADVLTLNANVGVVEVSGLERDEAPEFVEADVTGDARFHIDARLLRDALSNCQEVIVLRVMANGSLRVECGGQEDMVMVLGVKDAGDSKAVSAQKLLPKRKSAVTDKKAPAGERAAA